MTRFNLLVPTPFDCASIRKRLKQIRVRLDGNPDQWRPVMFSWSPFDKTDAQFLVGTRIADGALLASLARLFLREGNAVCVFDPEGDPNLSRVLARDGAKQELLFRLIDLNAHQGARPSIFGAADAQEVEGLTFSYFSLEDREGDSDFCRLQDRFAAARAATLAVEHNIRDPRELFEACLRDVLICSARSSMEHLRLYANRIEQTCARCRDFGRCPHFGDEDFGVGREV